MKEQSKKITIATTLIMLAALLFVAVFGVITKGFADNSLFANNANTNQIEQPNVVDGEVIKLLSLAGTSNDGYPTQTINATLTPTDDFVDVVFSVAWKEGAVNASNPVSNYITITPSKRACEIKCIKNFGSDVIVLTAEAGAFKSTATCNISFVGKAQNLAITTTEYLNSDTYIIERRKTGTFNIDVSNIFNSVSSNLSFKLGAVGELYFYTQTSTYGGDDYSNVHKENLNNVVDWFVSASIANNVVTVNAKESINDYKGVETHDDKGTPNEGRDDVMIFTNRYLNQATRYGEFQTEADFNKANLDSCYFTLTVTDTVSGLSKIIKFKVADKISVNLSNTSLQF